ncbi:acyl-CoA dehydrogenase family protein [Shimia sp.]|uniref:acyl-CoA dehydrogenase family protein n=1 Tax=Shimia sp. TaxID=1954381 RepID=UPI00356A0118
MDFTYSPRTEEMREKLRAFMDAHIQPRIRAHHEETHAGQFPVSFMEDLKALAREEGLWNLFLPGLKDDEPGTRLSNLEYAPLAEIMGRVPWSSEVFNCNAPDTGNMELLHMFATPQQRRDWLEPLMRGEIRSSFAMTEPDVASSDATNITTSMRRDGDDYVINGRKWFITNATHPNCRVFIVMGKTDPDAESHRQQSMIIVPKDTPGVEIVRNPTVLNHHAPEGHAEILFTDVRVPVSNLLGEEGSGFALAQARLGPGRIHHCMRSIGSAEKALDLMIERGLGREAFGKKIIDLGKNMETISRARIDIEAMRLMVLKAAKAMDVLGNKEARIWVSMIKALVPEKACEIIDASMQVHGATGMSQWSPLSGMYTWQRALRFADGPDEVHHQVIARAEVKAFQASNTRGSDGDI